MIKRLSLDRSKLKSSSDLLCAQFQLRIAKRLNHLLRVAPRLTKALLTSGSSFEERAFRETMIISGLVPSGQAGNFVTLDIINFMLPMNSTMIVGFFPRQEFGGVVRVILREDNPEKRSFYNVSELSVRTELRKARKCQRKKKKS